MSAIAKTASITLITAVPGSGKTLRLVWYVAAALKAGESVYVCNLNGLKLEGWHHFEDPTLWETLPPGSILVVDEAQKFFRAGWTEKDPNTGKACVPPCIAAMETIRHMGIRIILVTQHPNLIHANIRALVGHHEHIVRENGSNLVKVYTRSRVIDNVRSEKGLAAEDHHHWSLPQEHFDDYISAEVHTVKKTVKHRHKRAAWAMGLAVACFVASAALIAYAVAETMKEEPEEAAAQADVRKPSGGLEGSPRKSPEAEAKRWTSVAEYARDHLPRFATMPWTAPVFDQRVVTADPQLLCMVAGEGENVDGHYREASCMCVTEQATAYDMSDGECRRIARRGPIYNPYRTVNNEPPPSSQPVQVVTADLGPAVAVGIGEAAKQARYGQFRSEPQGPDKYEVSDF